MEILEHQALEMTNVLSYKNKLSPIELEKAMAKINAFIAQHGLERAGNTVTATFGVETQGIEQIIDVEILIPLSTPFAPTDKYILKELFYLDNAVKATHIGDPSGLQKTADSVNSYIAQNKLIPITAGYNITLTNPTDLADINDFKAEIYVGISRNVL